MNLELERIVTREIPRFVGSTRVDEVIQYFRREGLRHKIIYLYVCSLEGRLLGVVPIRRVLTGAPELTLEALMIKDPVTIPGDATPFQARAVLAKHRFLAVPVVDSAGRLEGLVDIERFSGDLGDPTERRGFDDLYEFLGFQVSEEQSRGVFGRFRLRFPWLLPTVLAGCASAMLTSFYEVTLARSVQLAFFVALVLGVNESVAMQSAHIAIQRGSASLEGVRRELAPGVLIGLGLSLLVVLVSYLWRGDLQATLILGLTLVVSVPISNLLGAAVPAVLHGLRLDSKIAAAPLALGAADLSALLIYFKWAQAILS